jgi:metal-sulfur cluster biosynthetic enzyme
MALTEQDVLIALKDCYDPELPVNIVDLGLVYAVRISPDENSAPAFPRQRVEVDLTMTTRACPAHSRILEQVRNRLAGVPEISETAVNLVWEPAWTPSRISPQTRERLRTNLRTKQDLIPFTGL